LTLTAKAKINMAAPQDGAAIFSRSAIFLTCLNGAILSTSIKQQRRRRLSLRSICRYFACVAGVVFGNAAQSEEGLINANEQTEVKA
jgi:hypothetical protein